MKRFLSTTTLKAPRLSGRDRIVTLPNGKVAITSKGRRRYKMSAAKRKKIAAAARRFKVPVLSTLAVVGPNFNAIKYMVGGDFQTGSKIILRNYTGYDLDEGKWRFQYMLRGVAPLLALALVKKTGVLKTPSRMLSKATSGLLTLG